MRAYNPSTEEDLHTHELVKDWTGEGFLTDAQSQSMQQETVSDLRRTNMFLRIVLAFFTVIVVVATVGLFFVVLNASRASSALLLIFAVITYSAAELAVSRARLYRHGIEEALAACSVGLLCAGIGNAAYGTSTFLVPVAGIIASTWIWHRFGLLYAPLAALIFVPWMASSWGASRPTQHIIAAAIFAAALFTVAAIRRRHRFTYLENQYSIAEAILWIGLYLAINLQLSSVDVLGTWWLGSSSTTDFPRPFYWTTWALAWCLPPLILARGLREKDRFVIAVGALTAILTLATNKPYLGWQRNTWDPMLLGALLIGIALFLRRWLAQGPNEIRRGFTARRLSGKDKAWMNLGSAAIGLAAPSAVTPAPQPRQDVHFGGGQSGGGGASSDY